MYLVSIDVGTKNLAYCIIDADTKKIKEWVVCGIPCVATNIHKLVEFLREAMPPGDEISDVVIEKQPSRNVKMRIMENILSTFFVMIGVSNVVSYSAKNKLGNIGKTAKGRTNYTLRKKMSVVMAGSYIDKIDDHHAKIIFKQSKKQDDLADCLLQALSYLKYDVNTLADPILNV
jgi:hypothetical protein